MSTPGPQLQPEEANQTISWVLQELSPMALNGEGEQMGENTVAVLSAFLTGLIMLLLTDLFFRVVVQADLDLDQEKILRCGLLTDITNPIGWLGNIGSGRPGRTAENHLLPHKNSDLHSDGPRIRLSVSSRILTITFGLLLLAFDVTLLYLLCTHEVDVNVDTKYMPAFKFQRPNTSALLVQNKPLCDSRPVTNRNGFRSLATVCTCAFSMFRDFEILKRDDIAFVGVSWGFKRVVFDVLTQGLANTYLQEVFIGLDNGTQYTTKPKVTAADVANVLPHVLRGRNLRILREVRLPNRNDTFMEWSSLYMIDMRDVRVPPAFSNALAAGLNLSDVRLGGNASRTSTEQNLYLAAVARASLSLTGRSEAFHRNPDTGPFLHEENVTLIRSVGPRLTVLDCGIICFVVSIAWAYVAFKLRWASGFEVSVLWERWMESLPSRVDIEEPSGKIQRV